MEREREIEPASHIKNRVLYFFAGLLTLFMPACGNNNDKTNEFPGYMEGEYVYISSAYAGQLDKLNVHAGEQVSRHQLLYSLDPHPEQDELVEVQARIGQAQSEQQKRQVSNTLRKSIFNRKQGLYNKKVISQEEFDLAHSLFQQTNFALLSAQANVAALIGQQQTIEWRLKQKTRFAPVEGIIFDIFYRVGEQVPGNSPVISLLEKNRIKAIFYCSQTQLANIQLNQPVSIQCDGCSGLYQAKITYISPQAEFTPPVLYSKEVRSSLSYRIEALPLASNPLPLHPGQPVTITLGAVFDVQR